jgi:hypothetical protein
MEKDYNEKYGALTKEVPERKMRAIKRRRAKLKIESNPSEGTPV